MRRLQAVHAAAPQQIVRQQQELIGRRGAIVILPLVRFSLFDDRFNAIVGEAENTFLHAWYRDACPHWELVMYVCAGDVRVANGVKPFINQLDIAAHARATIRIKRRKGGCGVPGTDKCSNVTSHRRTIGGIVSIVCPQIIPSPDDLGFLRRGRTFPQLDRMQFSQSLNKLLTRIVQVQIRVFVRKAVKQAAQFHDDLNRD